MEDSEGGNSGDDSDGSSFCDSGDESDGNNDGSSVCHGGDDSGSEDSQRDISALTHDTEDKPGSRGSKKLGPGRLGSQSSDSKPDCTGTGMDMPSECISTENLHTTENSSRANERTNSEIARLLPGDTSAADYRTTNDLVDDIANTHGGADTALTLLEREMNTDDADNTSNAMDIQALSDLEDCSLSSDNPSVVDTENTGM